MSAALGPCRPASRQVAALYAAWMGGSAATREELARDPVLFLHELDHLETGEKISLPERRPSRRDRLLGIGRIRRGSTPGEAALVRLLVKHRFDLVAAAEEVSLPVEVLAQTRTEPSVDLAIRNWRKHGRLPPASSARKLRPYKGLAGR